MAVTVAGETPGAGGTIALGDPVPWFGARTLAGAQVDLHVDAGRWVVLSFLGSLAEPTARTAIASLLDHAAAFREDHCVFYGILSETPADAAVLVGISGPAMGFIVDEGGALARTYGAEGSPRTIVLDPLLRAVANVALDHPDGHGHVVGGFLDHLPAVDASAGVPLTAPVLIVPRVFEFELCDALVDLYRRSGGEDSGFLLDQDGKTATVIDHRLKRRQDLVLVDPETRAVLRDRIVRRLLPAIERFFQFKATRMDRYMISCYDAELGGHFYRHRDNVNAGARHRRFAVSLNLNNEYDGCDLRCPEFGRQTYRAPAGGAIVFSCGMLHEVTPVTRGRRYAFVPFLYGEEDAAVREAMNAQLQAGETQYVGGLDRLFPDPA
jgi:predicted 2-oxoglutarate/Fe(II)-dependent dioxygenase YbiX/peroxiredoxin